MQNIKLQDLRKKDTKNAYIKEVLECSHDVIIEFSEYNNLPLPDLTNIKEVSDFLLLHVFTPEYNYDRNKQLYPNIYQRVTRWVVNRMTFGCYVYDTCSWLIENNLVSSDLIPDNKDITLRMQEADERQYQYIARTIINNANRATISQIM